MGIVVRNLSKDFVLGGKAIRVLDNINLFIGEGEFVCVLGPSGCGKSTLLNLIAGLEVPSGGSIAIDGAEMKGTDKNRAMIFQEAALFPWLKTIDNVEFGMKMMGIPKSRRRQKALDYLKMVHMTRFRDAYVHQLSGGMKQRVALARALSMDSKVLLMDEPFSALDSQTKYLLHLELQQIWLETHKTIVFVTHDIEEAVVLADRVIVMSVAPAGIRKEFAIKLARPRKVDDPDVAFMAREIMNELKNEVEKVAKMEYDAGWSMEKDMLLDSAYNDMGSGI